MNKRIFLLAVLLLLLAAPSFAARVDTLLVNSPSMNKDVQVIVVTPDAALGKKAVACPVIYLLHGYGGNAKTWIGVKPNLPQIADEKGIIFVCPDGKNSWYWDSPKNPSYRYETFISSELVKYIDEHYKTVADRKGRAITGLSMGGHGAMWNAIRHKDTFGAGGSTSGGVDIRPFPLNWEMAKQLGEFAHNKKAWDEHTVINQIDKIENGDLAIIIDCGESDFFLNVNKDLHNRLLARKINHDFITRPGGHAGKYWKNSIDYQILFFDKFFRK
ncbi:alpha/beta hydrolase family protein [Bacteroides acidifaciens]|uniref:alpha/beta hydrolase n=1 Tax=Bacteroides acidifaciens TaxID=85831 RepID=UPI00248CC463|nr:alpha/beta hydrolase family protein [Bacteroides acidifaciens]